MSSSGWLTRRSAPAARSAAPETAPSSSNQHTSACGKHDSCCSHAHTASSPPEDKVSDHDAAAASSAVSDLEEDPDQLLNAGNMQMLECPAVRGAAIFLLPPDSNWFQGQLFLDTSDGFTGVLLGTPTSKYKSVGLLCTELDMDPCMMCCYQGYGRYKLDLINTKVRDVCTYSPVSMLAARHLWLSTSNTNHLLFCDLVLAQSKKQTSLVVEKRGGDCLSLRTEAGGDRKPDEALFHIKFDTDQMQVCRHSNHYCPI
jgi:hypothetical protein